MEYAVFGLLLGTEAPVMTPNGIVFSFLFFPVFLCSADDCLCFAGAGALSAGECR